MNMSENLKKLLKTIKIGAAAVGIMAASVQFSLANKADAVPAGSMHKDNYAEVSVSGAADSQKIKKDDIDIMIPIYDPRKSHEANSMLAYSASQLIGGSLNNVSKMNGHYWMARPFLQGINLMSCVALAYYSHELGHGIENPKRLEFTGKPGDVYGLPELRAYGNEEDSLENKILSISSGINVNTLNSEKVFKNNSDELTYHEGLYFGRFGMNLIRYVFLDNPDESFLDEKTGKEIPFGDISRYRYYLKLKGIEISRDELKLEASLAEALTLYNYLAVYSNFNYLFAGDDNVSIPRIRLGGNEIVPPLVRLYLAQNGTFFNMDTILNPNSQNPAELNIGIDADMIGGGKVNTLRFGGKIRDIDIYNGSKTTISPFAYLNLERDSMEYMGHSIGMDIRLSEHLYVTVKNNHKDILFSEIRYEDDYSALFVLDF